MLRAVTQFSPDEVTVTGWAGSGFSLVTDVLGDGVYAGKLPVQWRTQVLVVMGEHLSTEGVSMLAALGVADPARTVATLGIGEALLFRRH